MLNLDPMQEKIARLWAKGATMREIALACQLPEKVLNNLVCRWRVKLPALFPRRRTRRTYMRKDIVALLDALMKDYPTDLRVRTVRDWLRKPSSTRMAVGKPR